MPLSPAIDNLVPLTILPLMLDPAIILDLQRAVVPPALTPPALVREWMSPAAEEAERMGNRMIADSEVQTKAWRDKLGQLEAHFPVTRDLSWSDEELGGLDTAIRVGERQLQERMKQADRMRRKGEKTNRRLAQIDSSLASVQKRHYERIDDLHRENIKALEVLLSKFREHRAFVDTRVGAEPGYVHRPQMPNKTTIAAMKRARAGDLETVTLDDLRAAILADD